MGGALLLLVCFVQCLWRGGFDKLKADQQTLSMIILKGRPKCCINNVAKILLFIDMIKAHDLTDDH